MKKRVMEPIDIGSNQEQGLVSVEKTTNQTATPLHGVRNSLVAIVMSVSALRGSLV